MDGYDRLYLDIFGETDENVAALKNRPSWFTEAVEKAISLLDKKEEAAIRQYYGIKDENLPIKISKKELPGKLFRAKREIQRNFPHMQDSLFYSWTDVAKLYDNSQKEISKLLDIIREFGSSVDLGYLEELEPYDWSWSVRTYNRLRKAGITSLIELSKTDPNKLREIEGFGRKSQEEVANRLKRLKTAFTLREILRGEYTTERW